MLNFLRKYKLIIFISSGLLSGIFLFILNFDKYEPVNYLFNQKQNIIPLFPKNNIENKVSLISEKDKNFDLYRKIDLNSNLVLSFDKKLKKIFLKTLPYSFEVNGKDIKEGAINILDFEASIGDKISFNGKEFVISEKLNEVIKFYEISNGITWNLNPKTKIKVKNELEKYNYSFESGLWQKTAQVCEKKSSGESDVYVLLSNDASNGKKSLELGSKNHTACISSNFNVDLKKGKQYSLRFDYKGIEAKNSRFLLTLITNNGNPSFSGSIDLKDNKWHTFNFPLSPVDDVLMVIFTFYSESDGSWENVVRFDNVRIEEKINTSKEFKIEDKFLNKNFLISELELNFGGNNFKFNGEEKYNDNLEDYYLFLKSSKLTLDTILEYKKIGIGKYRLVIHKAKNEFNLPFFESLSNGYSIYLSEFEDLNNIVGLKPKLYEKLGNYEYNKDDLYMADSSDIRLFLDNNYLSFDQSFLENDKKLSFVSKNLSNTIRNDNLNNGTFFEGWFSKTLMPNNGVLNIKDLCFNNSKCKQNTDGTYSLELIIRSRIRETSVFGFILFILIFGIYLGYYLFFGIKKFILSKFFSNIKKNLIKLIDIKGKKKVLKLFFSKIVLTSSTWSEIINSLPKDRKFLPLAIISSKVFWEKLFILLKKKDFWIIIFKFGITLALCIYYITTHLSGEFDLLSFMALLYGCLSILFIIESRVAAFVALVYLIMCPFLLIFKKDVLAEEMAVQAYYFLVITVVTQVRELRRIRK